MPPRSRQNAIHLTVTAKIDTMHQSNMARSLHVFPCRNSRILDRLTTILEFVTRVISRDSDLPRFGSVPIAAVH